MSMSKKLLSGFVSFLIIFAFSQGAFAERDTDIIKLPKSVGSWTRSDSPRVITSENIYDYMNGSGELYLGYRFHYLEVFDYGSEKNNNVLVELYFMENSDDAFGLLSLDWGGEPVLFVSSPEGIQSGSFIAPARALYGAGLLRIWSGKVYARVLGFPETTASKKAVLDLGKAIISNRKNPPEPGLLQKLPLKVGTGWKMLSKRLSYFRSHLALNSVYYLSHENILDIDLSTEAVTAPYEKISDQGVTERCQVLLVKYESPVRVREALKHFQGTYLPELKKTSTKDLTDGTPSYVELEDGWLGYLLADNYLTMVFGCPDQKSARIILHTAGSN